MAAWEAERAVLTRWAEEAKVLVKECEASRVAGLVNSLRVLSLTLCAESGACADEKEMEEEKMEEVEKEEKVCLEESNSALRTALEKAERVTHELEDRVTGLEAAARRSQGAWEAKEKEAKRLALEVESVKRLNDELKMENEGLKRCGGEVSVNGVSEEKEETEKEGVNEEENGVNEEKASEEEKEVGKEGVNEEENAMTEEKEMEEEKASEVEKEEMKVEKEEEEKEALKKKEKMEEVVVEEKAEEEKAKEATEEKESGMEGENGVNQKENKKEMEEEQKKEEAAYEKEETPMKGENTVNEKKEEKEEEQNEKEKEEENKETTNEQATTPETDNHPPKAETEKLSQKRAAEENPNPPSKKPYTLTLSTLKLRIRYAFEKWNPKWMRRMKAVSDKLDKMTKTPEEGFKEMCTMYCIGRGVMGSYKWDEAKIQEMEKIQSQSDYDAMVQEWKKNWVCLLRKRDHTAESGMRFKQEMEQMGNQSGNCSSSFQPQIVSSNSLITTWYVVSACASLCVDCAWKGMLTAL